MSAWLTITKKLASPTFWWNLAGYAALPEFFLAAHYFCIAQYVARLTPRSASPFVFTPWRLRSTVASRNACPWHTVTSAWLIFGARHSASQATHAIRGLGGPSSLR